MNISKPIVLRTPVRCYRSSLSRLLHSSKPVKTRSRLPLSTRNALPNRGPQLDDLSYKVMTGLAGLGCLETIYLTLSKFLNKPVICLANGCDSVLSSGYSEIYGIPISLFGFFGYTSILIFAMECEKTTKSFPFKTLLISSTSIMSASSGVLIYTLMTKLDNAFCLWCYLSAFLSISLFLVSLLTIKEDEKMSVLMPSGGMALVCSLALLAVFNQVDDAFANDLIIEYQDPVVTTESDEGKVELAKDLEEAGVKMFGAFWCNHCYDQKQAFGKEAMKYFPYVECYPNGYKKGVKIAKQCEDAEINGYPTWLFGTRQIAGEQTLETLQEALREYRP